MTHTMRRSDRRLDEKAAEMILKNGAYGVLSTIGEDGCPYGVPLTYAYEDRRIYFHCAHEGHKVENLRFNDSASFCVIGETQVLPDKFSIRYESAIAGGHVREVTGEEKIAALTMLIAKFSKGYEEKGAAYIQNDQHKTAVYCLEIEEMTGKARR